jgi:hypothetical protein
MEYRKIPRYSTGAFGQNDFYGIPLPNEKEDLVEYRAPKKGIPIISNVINYIRRNIKIEEIILIGLIILLLDESIEDDLLLVILLYILLF